MPLARRLQDSLHDISLDCCERSPNHGQPGIREIKAPILYVLGGASSIVLDTQQQLNQTLPRVQITSMHGLGHYRSDERPGEFLAIADTFPSAATR